MHDADDTDHRACVLDAAGTTGPSIALRCRRRSRTLNARRRIVARAYQGISASASRGGGGAPVRGRLHPLALRFGYQGSPVGQRIGVKHAGCGLITERGLLWRACEMNPPACGGVSVSRPSPQIGWKTVDLKFGI